MRKIRAQGFVEYALLLATVVVAVVAALTIFKGTITSLFASVNAILATAV